METELLEDALELNALKELPRTWQKREALGVEVLWVEATLEEYFYLLEKIDYRIEYYRGKIFSFMDQASITHETLVIYLGYLFTHDYLNLADFQILSSNIKIFSEQCTASFNADLSVVKGDIEFLTLPSGKKSKATLTNPYIIVEILSESTQGLDFGEKLSCYKTITSLQQIVFIDQASVYISSYTRNNKPNEWINQDYRSITETLKLIDFDLKIEEIYRKVKDLK